MRFLSITFMLYHCIKEEVAIRVHKLDLCHVELWVYDHKGRPQHNPFINCVKLLNSNMTSLVKWTQRDSIE
jgi:hypothetical protein